MALWSVLNSRTRSVIESSRKPLWVTGPSRVRISPSPPHRRDLSQLGPSAAVLRFSIGDYFIGVAGPRTFRGNVRYFRPETASGLAVIDIPAAVTKELGGLKQLKVKGVINGVEFTSNTMPAGGGILAVSVSKKLLDAAKLSVGDRAA